MAVSAITDGTGDNMTDDLLDFLLGSIVGMAGYFFGGLDGFMQVLIILTVIDYISGVMAAGVKGELSSREGFNGIKRKVLIFAFVGISHVIDKNFLGDTATVRTAVCFFYIGNEGMSIFENADKLGIPLPKILIKNFKQFKEEHENDSKQDNTKNYERKEKNNK